MEIHHLQITIRKITNNRKDQFSKSNYDGTKSLHNYSKRKEICTGFRNTQNKILEIAKISAKKCFFSTVATVVGFIREPG